MIRVGAEGRPLRDRWLHIEPLDSPVVAFTRRRRADAEGRLVLDPAPPGRLRVRAFAATWRPGSDAEPETVLGEVAAATVAATLVLRP